MKFLYFLALLLLVSCSPLQRLNRLQTRHPQLFTEIKDTVIHMDTITVNVPEIELDTFVLYSDIKDTLHVEKKECRRACGNARIHYL